MYDKFIYFGFTGSGNPICIDESKSQLVYIDYDNENKVVLINSTIEKFAESLLVYVEFIKEVKVANGRKAYIEKIYLKVWWSGFLVHFEKLMQLL